jgi:hypothetical protein
LMCPALPRRPADPRLSSRPGTSEVESCAPGPDSRLADVRRVGEGGTPSLPSGSSVFPAAGVSQKATAPIDLCTAHPYRHAFTNRIILFMQAHAHTHTHAHTHAHTHPAAGDGRGGSARGEL